MLRFAVRSGWEHMFVQAGYRYRVYPTDEQAMMLLNQMGICRWVWNEAHALRQRVWHTEGRSVGYAQLCRHLTVARSESEWLRAGSVDCQQQAIRELCAAYGRTFTARMTTGRKVPLPGPRRKRGSGWKTVRYTRNGYRLDPDGGLLLAGVKGGIIVRWSRGLPSHPTGVSVTLDAAGRWHASLCVEVKETPLSPTGRTVGVDLGVKAALALSDGAVIENPRHLRRRERALARSQRTLARACKGSKNRAKAKMKVARCHAQVRDARRDWQHKATTALVRENDVICVEDLNVKGMSATAKGTIEQPGRNVAQKAGLNRAVLDVGFGTIRSQLVYKASLYGRDLRVVDRWLPSSKTCSGCGHARTKLALSERTYTCDRCGLVLHRDINAALNILAAGLAESQNACGEHVRPRPPRRPGQRSMKQETRRATAGNPFSKEGEEVNSGHSKRSASIGRIAAARQAG